MNITYFGKAEDRNVRIRHGNGNTTFLKQRIIDHSPDGFNWGYGGSGPSDLALNMLYDHFIRTGRAQPKRLAYQLYQAFKWAFIASASGELRITGQQIEDWLKTKRIRRLIKEMEA